LVNPAETNDEGPTVILRTSTHILLH
jgi:hypothetical protein